MPTDNATAQQGEPGPWNERLPHFRLEFTPSAGDELQSEYLVPRVVAVDALRALAPLGSRIAEVLLVSELRSVAADPLWLSPSFERDSLAIHFTWQPDTAAVLPVLAEIEAALAPFEARPHWGKVFAVSPAAVAARYPRLDDFRSLASELDPGRKFVNDFVGRYLLGSG
jgi:xylitol oxidase